MVTGSKKWPTIAGAGLLAISLTACQLGPVSFLTPSGSDAVSVTTDAAASLPAAASPTRKPTGPKTVTVKRDSITQTVDLNGVVTAVDQSQVTVNARGTVLSVDAKIGQAVKQGDPLVSLDPTDLPKQLTSAQAHLKQSQANFEQGQQQVTAAQLAAASRYSDAQQQQSKALADAQLQLQRAQANLVAVQAGKSQTDRQVAQASVASATTAMQQSQAALDNVLGGPDANAVRTAQRQVSDAQAALAAAQANFAALTRGPDPSAVRDAQSALDRAKTQLQIAQAAKPDTKADSTVAKLQQDAAVNDAQTGVQRAQDALAKLKAPPSAIDVQAAQQKVQDAQDTLNTAQTNLANAQAGPDQAAVGTAQHALDGAKQTLAQAQAGQAEVSSHPTPAELQNAQDQVRAAQAAVDVARKPITTQDPGGPDLAALQAAVDQDQATIDSLQQALDNTHVVAPFDGTVAAIRVKPGSPVLPSQAVAVVARPGAPVVHVDLDDSEASLVALGQQGTIKTDASTSARSQNTATVTNLTPPAADGTRAASADLQPEWADGSSPRLGTPVQVSLVVQQKQDVLVVPTNALHVSGAGATVEVMNGSLKRFINVQVGIKTDSTAEVVSGLSEGQLVLVANS